MIDQPPTTSSSDVNTLGQFRGIWMEIEQNYQNASLTVSTNLMGLNGWEDTAFSFFFKAEECVVGEKTLKGPQFSCYKGPPLPILMKGKEGKIELNLSTAITEIQVVPLEGKNNFWGANFLVSYLLEPKQREYVWTLSS